jgi:uncharacterized membrane protein YdjX (TVP38/TMEM64 family)
VWLKVGVIVVLVGILAGAWATLPLRDLTNPEAIAALIEPVTKSPFLPLYVLAAFEIAGAMMLSVWLIIFQTCLLYSPSIAFPLALGGATLSAVTFFALGKLLGRDVVMKIVPPRIQRALERVTLESIIAIRILPILPFTLVNMTCGAFGVPLRTFVLGTVLGMAPGVLGMTLLGDRLLAVIRQPTVEAILGLVGVAVVLIIVAMFFRRRAAAQHLKQALEPAGAAEAAK